MAVVYHWKHGWIPLDHVAALSKAKGNHAAAAKMLSDVHSANGIQSRQHVAHAVLDLPNLHDHADRADAMAQVHHAAARHDSTDLLPGHREAQKANARSALQAQLDAFRAKSPKHTSAPIKMKPENAPSQAELADSQNLYGSGKEFYVQMRAEGKSHETAMRMAADKFGIRPAPDSNPHQRDPGATSRPDVPSAGEVQRAQAKADRTTADTMSKISDENLRANIEKYRANAPGSPTLRILETEALRRGMPEGAKRGRTADELRAAAEAKHAEAQRIAGNVGWGDRAAGRLSPKGLKQAHKGTDSALRRFGEAERAAKELEHKAGLQAAREREAARQRFTSADLANADVIHDGTTWRRVVRTNAKSVTVETPYSWTDSIPVEKVTKHATYTESKHLEQLSTGRLRQIVRDAKNGNPTAQARLATVQAILRNRK